jgi:hypothetical protein
MMMMKQSKDWTDVINEQLQGIAGLKDCWSWTIIPLKEQGDRLRLRAFVRTRGHQFGD